jgi:GTP-binding protein EngB required for normal cell division
MCDPSRQVVLKERSGLDSQSQGIPPIITSSVHEPNSVSEVVPYLIQILHNFGPEYHGHTKGLADLQARLAEGRFHLAILGQFKRGKSTFINALIGEEILPSSVIPVTSIPTFIQYGDRMKIVIHFQNQEDKEYMIENSRELNRILSRYVSENENPKNTLCVTHADVFHPTPFLRDVVLIDTPGIGSTHRHNTEMTLSFLTQCDAAFLLVSSDPPITEVEVDFIRQVQERVARIFFILNKIDYLNDTERVTVIKFLRKVLVKSKISDCDDTIILPVSAKQGLASKQRNDAILWKNSGFEAVADHLKNFLAQEKNAVLKLAITAKARNIINDALLQIKLRIRSLELPLTEVEQRLRLFDDKIREAEEQRLYAQDILAGDKTRITQHLESLAEELRTSSREQLLDIVNDTLKTEIDEEKVQDTIASVIPKIYKKKLTEVNEAMNKELIQVLKSHQKRADDLIESIRIAAAELFDIPYHAPESEQAFEKNRKPFWVSQESWDCMFNPIPKELIDRLAPQSVRERRIRERMKEHIEYLVTRNVENLRWETLQNLNLSFLKFGNALDKDIKDTIKATHGAIKTTYKMRKKHVNETRSELGRLRTAEEKIKTALQTLGGP